MLDLPVLPGGFPTELPIEAEEPCFHEKPQDGRI
jgi:hypothetical protein